MSAEEEGCRKWREWEREMMGLRGDENTHSLGEPKLFIIDKPPLCNILFRHFYHRH